MSRRAAVPAAIPESVRDAVSRETLDDLICLVTELDIWQNAKNLVGGKTLDDVWTRHIADSLQLRHHAPEARRWLDLGSGAGLPGLVIAIMLKHENAGSDSAGGDADPGPMVHCVESNARKCAFIRHVARLTAAPVRVHNARIEDVIADFVGRVDVVTARALAPLPKLLDWTSPLLTTGVMGLFPKGDRAEIELTESFKCWRFDNEISPSISDPRGRILRITGLKPA
ncbi:MAG: 16S rRNA (guanine(527)-N(7))-methyltransferase RsmG [Salinarimonas sp.]|nr:16S rRNA (guanine(527)-N(7))-methyltransferase RsmG [Salinarimonas sp.]